VKPLKSPKEDILKAIELHYKNSQTKVFQIISDLEPQKFTDNIESNDISHLRDIASEAPIIRLVNHIISKAVESRASDIHIEPFEETLKVRYRIDDILHDIEKLPVHLLSAIISRIKILANLNIAERRLPQDGKIKVKIGSKDIDLRVATIPIIHGEGAVLRILDRSNLSLDLEKLGLSNEVKKAFEPMITRPYGMILVTGPTGSGKTTTLYATLEKLNTPDKKIITIEDPVEYQLFGVNQIQVKPQIGLTFANGLRNIVRMDPNIILVGEIRDRETAEIAINSALTGHLVFSTLHTNDAAGAIARLLEMGLEDFLLASCLIGIVAQRLVRKICAKCKKNFHPNSAQMRDLESVKLKLQNIRWDMETKPFHDREIKIYKGEGCDECGQTGYWGRIGAFEILPIDEKIRSLMLKNPDAGSIKTEAVRSGMRTLKEDGLKLVLEGTTTMEEVYRITQED
jgi:general secretion pathway protein E